MNSPLRSSNYRASLVYNLTIKKYFGIDRLQALILAAGRGQRLMPVTEDIPKPLVRIGQYTLIEYHIMRLVVCGVRRIVINVSYKAEQIIDYLKNGARYGAQITYSTEDTQPLETGGGIKQALSYIDADPFIVVNSDVLCDFNFASLDVSQTYLANLVMVSNPDHNKQGDFVLSSSGLVSPIFDDSAPTYTFSGIGLYRQGLFSGFPQGRFSLISVLQEPIQQSQISGEVFSGQWIDVGTPFRLAQAQKNFVFDT